MNQSKKQFIANLNPSYKGHIDWLLSNQPLDVIQVVQAVEKRNKYILRSKTLERVESEGYTSISFLEKEIKLLEAVVNVHGTFIKANIKVQDVYEIEDQKYTWSRTANSLHRDQYESSEYTHYFKVSDEQVSILKNNFPDIWDKL